MDRAEFAKVMAYIGVAIGKPLTQEAHEVYFDLLGDLSVKALETAAQRVLLEHRWATFPSIAELREAAALTIRGEVKAMSGGEAWELAWYAVKNIDPELEYTVKKEMDALPPLVRESVKCMGLLALCYGDEPVAVVRGQFLKIFAELSAREQRLALLPPATRAAIAAAPENFAAPVRALLNSIGLEVPQT